MALRDQPYFKMYAKDFLSDEKLRMCSPESVGVYIMTMCYLHRTPKYGALTLAEWQKESEDNIENFAKVLLRQLPFGFDEIVRGIRQLVREGALSVDGDTLYQKRMVRDGEISETRAISGASGGESKRDNLAKAKQNNSKQRSKNLANDVAEEQQNPEYELVLEYESLGNNSLGKVTSYYMDKFNPTPSGELIELLKDYTEALGADVVIHAMEICLNERKFAWSYLNGILRRYKAEGLDTLEKVVQAEQRFQAVKKQTTAGSRSGRPKAKAPEEYKGDDFIAYMMEGKKDGA